MPPGGSASLLIAGGLCLVDPGLITDIIGAALAAIVIGAQIIVRRRAAAAGSCVNGEQCRI